MLVKIANGSYISAEQVKAITVVPEGRGDLACFLVRITIDENLNMDVKKETVEDALDFAGEVADTINEALGEE